MSLTNEMTRIKLIADDIALNKKRELKAPGSMVQNIDKSYYEKRTKDSNEPQNIIREYDFETPVEIKLLLENMWKEMGKDEMLRFITVSMVASAKNKPLEGKSVIEHKVSSFIYEF